MNAAHRSSRLTDEGWLTDKGGSSTKGGSPMKAGGRMKRAGTVKTTGSVKTAGTVKVARAISPAETLNASTPAWAVHGLRPWTLLLWIPICLSMLIGPISDPTPGLHSASSWVAVTAAAAIFIAVVLTRYRPGTASDRTARLLLALLAALAVGTTLAWSPAWSALFVLLAVGLGIVIVDRTAPLWILALAAVAIVTNLLGAGSTDDALTSALTILPTGLGTYAVHQLFATVAELRCARMELAKMAVAQERDRFARDLHDLLGHTLSVIVVKAEAVRRLAPLDSSAATVHAADIESIGREALTDIRRAASGYRGAGLDRELTRARTALEAGGVALSLEQQPTPNLPLPEETDVLLGWVVREGVTNVLRHARATHCTIGVRQADAVVRLTIEDDGSGIGSDAAEVPSASASSDDPPVAGGVGLLGLAERVAAVGGTVNARPTEKGFRITVTVPYLPEHVARQHPPTDHTPPHHAPTNHTPTTHMSPDHTPTNRTPPDHTPTTDHTPTQHASTTDRDRTPTEHVDGARAQ